MSAKVIVKDLNFSYNHQRVLSSINLTVEANSILGIMGPAKSGKTTLLRVFNRLCDLIPNIHIEGEVFLDEENILRPDIDVDKLRKRVGMVFDKPVPLPRSIFENLAFGPKLHGIKDKNKIEEALQSLKRNYTIVLVSNNTWQVARTSDNVAFLLIGELVEYGSTHGVFTVPKDKRTDDYISGRF